MAATTIKGTRGPSRRLPLHRPPPPLRGSSLLVGVEIRRDGPGRRLPPRKGGGEGAAHRRLRLRRRLRRRREGSGRRYSGRRSAEGCLPRRRSANDSSSSATIGKWRRRRQRRRSISRLAGGRAPTSWKLFGRPRGGDCPRRRGSGRFAIVTAAAVAAAIVSIATAGTRRTCTGSKIPRLAVMTTTAMATTSRPRPWYHAAISPSCTWVPLITPVLPAIDPCSGASARVS
mmetsp:Transcript_55221/g.165444  ORF Transcript_55221/g.165444 Transcript_55221/m.165444 type:complete len:230 (+) Transcript_55221:1220-1909(+)